MNSLLEHISLLTRILGSPVSPVTLAASVPRDDAGDFDYRALTEELKHQGFENYLQERPLRKIPQLALPAVILLRDGEAAVLKKLSGEEAVVEFAGIGEQRLATSDLQEQYMGYAWFIKPKAAKDVRSELPEYELPKGWFWRVIWRFRRYYYQVIIATFLINFLALVSSLYVMRLACHLLRISRQTHPRPPDRHRREKSRPHHLRRALPPRDAAAHGGQTRLLRLVCQQPARL